MLHQPLVTDHFTAERVAQDAARMAEAMEQARAAAALGEVPVGAVLYSGDTRIAQAHNRRELDHDPLAHAEILVLREASQALGEWRLIGCTLYVTLEPCPMCAGAIVNSRVERVVFGASDPRAGACGSIMNILDDPRLNHRPPVTSGVCGEESSALLKSFFAARRKSGSKKP